MTTGVSSADVLALRNGDRLTGTVVSLAGGTLQFRTSYAGVLKVPAAEISSLGTDGVMTLRYKSGGYSTGRLGTSYGGTLRMEPVGGGQPAVVNVAAISEIHRGTEIPRGFRWSGRLNVGATARNGNSDTRSIHIDTALKGRAEKDRIRLEGEFNREFDGSDRTVDDLTVFAQHDRFVTKSLYFYTNIKFERDTPQDLRLRSTVGTGGGWQILETDRTNLSVELGPAYANEDFDAGTDRDFVAGRWAVNFDQWVWRKMAQLFHQHEGTMDLEDTGNVFIDSSTGLRFPLADSFRLTAQADIDWDSDPAPGVSSTDTLYLMTVGYSW